MTPIFSVIFDYIALVGYAYLFYNYYKLSRKYKELALEYHDLFKEDEGLLFDSTFADSEVFIRDAFDHFEVLRDGKYRSIIISVIEYDPDDIDDKEYKRIHAEEIAEILNEKP